MRSSQTSEKTGNAVPLVSIIIANLNGERFITGCLKSISEQTFKSFELIFIDNGSSDGSLALVKKLMPQAATIKNAENLGFAAANNQGIMRSSGKYVLTLNNDTELNPRFLEELMKKAEGSGPDTGMWATKILSINEKNLIDSVGGLLLYPDGIAKGRGRLEKDNGRFDAPEEALMPSACAGLYRKSMLDQIGMFDEDFFAYCEDTDLGLRARLAGWKTQSAPRAIVYHHYSGTGGKYSRQKAYLVERNRLWVAIKNFPLRRIAVLPLYTFWRYALQCYGLIAKKGAGGRFVENFSSFQLALILLKAELHALTGLPAMLAKRRATQKLRKASSQEVAAWFKQYSISASSLVLKD